MYLQLVNDQGIVEYQTKLCDDKVVNGNYDRSVASLKNFVSTLTEAIKLFIQRNDEYGETWELPEFPKHEVMLTALVCLTKSKRICNMLDKENGLQRYYKQIAANTLDLINFSGFLLQQVPKHIEGPK